MPCYSLLLPFSSTPLKFCPSLSNSTQSYAEFLWRSSFRLQFLLFPLQFHLIFQTFANSFSIFLFNSIPFSRLLCLPFSLSTSELYPHRSFLRCCFEGSAPKEEVALQQLHSASSHAMFTPTTCNIHPSITSVTRLITAFRLQVLAKSLHLHSIPTPFTPHTTSIHLFPTPAHISRLSLALPAPLLNNHWHHQHLGQIPAGSAIQQLLHFSISHPYLAYHSSLPFHPHSLLPDISLKIPSSSVFRTSSAISTSFHIQILLPFAFSSSWFNRPPYLHSPHSSVTPFVSFSKFWHYTPLYRSTIGPVSLFQHIAIPIAPTDCSRDYSNTVIPALQSSDNHLSPWCRYGPS